MKKMIFFVLVCVFYSNLFAQKMTVKDSDSNVLMEVNDEGTMGSVALSDTNVALGSEDNKLYSRNDTLIWNGTALGTGTDGASDINGLSDGRTAGNSIFLGSAAGAVDDGNDRYNLAVGVNAFKTSVTGSGNIAIGNWTLEGNTGGWNNVALGAWALCLNTTGNTNTALGVGANCYNTTGKCNTSIGNDALYRNTIGEYNTVVGKFANYYNQEGSNNTIIGYEAGKGTADHNKSGNIFIGFQAGFNESGDNKLYIENSNSATPLIGGDFAADEVYLNGDVAIGTTSPTAKLDISGSAGYDQLRMRTSYTPTSSSDTNGNTGDIAWDDNYVYIKTSSGWKRSGLSTF